MGTTRLLPSGRGPLPTHSADHRRASRLREPVLDPHQGHPDPARPAVLRQAAEVTGSACRSRGLRRRTAVAQRRALTPSPRRRLDAVRTLVDAGFEVGVLMARSCPPQRDPSRRRDGAAIAASGASSGHTALHLRPGARGVRALLGRNTPPGPPYASCTRPAPTRARTSGSYARCGSPPRRTACTGASPAQPAPARSRHPRQRQRAAQPALAAHRYAAAVREIIDGRFVGSDSGQSVLWASNACRARGGTGPPRRRPLVLVPRYRWWRALGLHGQIPLRRALAVGRGLIGGARVGGCARSADPPDSAVIAVVGGPAPSQGLAQRAVTDAAVRLAHHPVNPTADEFRQRVYRSRPRSRTRSTWSSLPPGGRRGRGGPRGGGDRRPAVGFSSHRVARGPRDRHRGGIDR